VLLSRECFASLKVFRRGVLCGVKSGLRSGRGDDEKMGRSCRSGVGCGPGEQVGGCVMPAFYAAMIEERGWFRPEWGRFILWCRGILVRL